MIKLAPVFSAEERAELARAEERVLSVAEFEGRIRVPMSDYEREDFDGLVRWFTHRYPSGGERMRAIRARVRQLRQRIGR